MNYKQLSKETNRK